MTISPKLKKIIRRIFRITVVSILVVLGIILLILVLIQTAPVQNFARRKIESYLQTKLKTTVRIGDLDIGFPTKIILKNIYLEDRRKDTLVYGGRIEVDIAMFKLLQHQVRVSSVDLDAVTVKVNRTLPDSVFNFQFIIDAFSSPGKEPEKASDSSAGFSFSIGRISLHHISALYKDDATGNDAGIRLGDFSCRLGIFDPAHQHYAIPDISLADLSGRFRQYQPVLILQKMVDTVNRHNSEEQPVRVELKQIGFKNIAFDYRNDATPMDAALRLGELVTTVDSVDLNKMYFRLKSVRLDNTLASAKMGKVLLKKKAAKAAAEKLATPAGWQFVVDGISLENDHLQYDDENKQPAGRGLDPNHLDVQQLVIRASNIQASPTAYSAVISQIAFAEKSGFRLRHFAGNLAYDTVSARVKDLVLQTDHSTIRNQTMVRYISLAQASKRPGEIKTDLLFDHSSIAAADLLLLAPDLSSRLKGNERAVLKLNGRVGGQLNNLLIPYLEISGIGTSSLAASGSIRGLPDAKKAWYDIVVKKLVVTKSDILPFIPATALPASVRLPEKLTADGHFKGSVSNFQVLLHAQTNIGDANVDGTLDLNRKIYNLKASTRMLDLGYLLKQDSLLGKFTLEATANGSGFDPRKMNTVFQARLINGEIWQYAYQGLVLNGSLHNGSGTLESSMKDDNLTYELHAEASFLQKYPSLKLTLQLDTLNPLALHLGSDSFQLHLTTTADFASTDPDSLQGQLGVYNIAYTDPKRMLSTDTIRLVAAHSDTAEHILFRSEMADLDLNGRYKLTEMGTSLTALIDKYYRLGNGETKSVAPQDWQLAMKFRATPLVLAWMPSLKGTDSVEGKIYFNSSASDLHLLITAPRIQLDQQVIRQVSVQASTGDTALAYGIFVAGAASPGFQMYQTSLTGSFAHDRLQSIIVIKDKKAKERYRLGGSLSKRADGFRIVLNADSLLLNYDRWTVPADNYIQYNSSGFVIRELKLQHGDRDELLGINSRTASPRAPLDISFTNFKIKTITQFADQDSLLVDGLINGKADVMNLGTGSNPVFNSDLRIDNLTYKTDTVGNLIVKLNNKETNALAADISLEGRENDVKITGNYRTDAGQMDLVAKLNQLNLASVKTFMAGQVKDMTGYLKGSVHASGSLTQPLLRGELRFENALITPVISGEPLKLSGDAVSFDEDGFNFSMFKFTDSAGDEATLDGNVYTRDFRDYKFDLSFNADNFRLVNAPKEPNRLFYGKLNINASVDVSGDLKLPKINAYIRANPKTDLIMILPSNNPEIVDREGVVLFTDDKHPVDSLKLQRMLDSLARNSSLKGLDLTAALETDSNAQFTLVIDERNGDALALRGRADLAGGIDKSGKTSLTGSYELEHGSYNLTLSVLHRKFDIQRGSTITWTGDPSKANIDITAIYTVSAASIDLVEQQLAGRQTDEVNKFKQRLPFQVILKMTGELLKPVISFDIALPNDLLALWPDVDLKLQQLRTDEAETNKQVFALLLLGRFVSENPFESAAGGMTTGSVARQSASKILSDQLNQLAGSLIKGVDISFDLNSQEDYSSGYEVNQTQLNVGVSKNLFSDRIRVTVGSDFQLQQTNPNQNASNIAGDVSVDYRLSKDGRYMLRAYRKDQYESVVEGQVVETGLSFILTLDYNVFKELFQNKKEEKKVIKPKPKPHSTGIPEAKK
jgi:TamB, inner membrane protein subunit of TAM complex